MSSRTTNLDAAAVLAAARRFRAEADAAEVGVLEQALAWAELHPATNPDDAATWGDSPYPLAGPGAPLVMEFCIAEFAAAIGRSTDAGRALLAHAVELAYRLPRTWHRIQAGDLQVYRARRIAEKTLMLTPDAADFVDREVAAVAHKIGITRLERLVDEAIATHMPETAREIAQAAAETRRVTVEHTHVSFAGTSRIEGELDLADALDLEAALQAGAQHLADLGSADPLDVRRAAALGLLARGQLAELPASRQMVLYVHLSEETGIAHVENTGGHLVTADQVRAWCGDADVVVKPVIDLHDPTSTPAYAVPERLAERVALRDRTCVFPWCNRSARSCDKDHISPYAESRTTDDRNLAALCRRHHRLKTLSTWTYTTTAPGSYLWRSPYGYRYRRDGTGTTEFTPSAVAAPSAA